MANPWNFGEVVARIIAQQQALKQSAQQNALEMQMRDAQAEREYQLRRAGQEEQLRIGNMAYEEQLKQTAAAQATEENSRIVRNLATARTPDLRGKMPSWLAQFITPQLDENGTMLASEFEKILGHATTLRAAELNDIYGYKSAARIKDLNDQQQRLASGIIRGAAGIQFPSATPTPKPESRGFLGNLLYNADQFFMHPGEDRKYQWQTPEDVAAYDPLANFANERWMKENNAREAGTTFMGTKADPLTAPTVEFLQTMPSLVAAAQRNFTSEGGLGAADQALMNDAFNRYTFISTLVNRKLMPADLPVTFQMQDPRTGKKVEQTYTAKDLLATYGPSIERLTGARDAAMSIQLGEMLKKWMGQYGTMYEQRQEHPMPPVRQ